MNSNTSFVYCREFALGTVSLTGDWARGDDSKRNSYYNRFVHVLIDTPALRTVPNNNILKRAVSNYIQ